MRARQAWQSQRAAAVKGQALVRGWAGRQAAKVAHEAARQLEAAEEAEREAERQLLREEKERLKASYVLYCQRMQSKAERTADLKSKFTPSEPAKHAGVNLTTLLVHSAGSRGPGACAARPSGVCLWLLLSVSVDPGAHPDLAERQRG